MVYKIDKKSALLTKKSISGSGVNTEVKHNEQLAKELRKPIIRNFKKRTVYSGFTYSIWGADLADMQLRDMQLRNLDSYCVLLKFLVNMLGSFKDKKGANIVDAFQKTDDSNSSKAKSKGRKPNKIWVDKGSEFYNNFFKKLLNDNDIETYSIHNEGKSVVPERFIRTRKTKIYKYMTSVSKNAYIDKLDDIVSEYNNTYHRKFKMKPGDV